MPQIYRAALPRAKLRNRWTKFMAEAIALDIESLREHGNRVRQPKNRSSVHRAFCTQHVMLLIMSKVTRGPRYAEASQTFSNS